MAIEVLSPGKLPEDLFLRGTCDHCGCLVRCLKKDADFKSDMRNDFWLSVPCPTKGCHKEIYLTCERADR